METTFEAKDVTVSFDDLGCGGWMMTISYTVELFGETLRRQCKRYVTNKNDLAAFGFGKVLVGTCGKRRSPVAYTLDVYKNNDGKWLATTRMLGHHRATTQGTIDGVYASQ